MTIPSLIAGVYSVGDPWQKPNASNVTGDGRGGRGVFHAKYPSAGAVRDAFYSAAYAKHSLCHAKDPICDVLGSIPAGGNVSPHLNYFNGSEVNTEATVLARMVSGASTAPPIGTSALNVAFVVDTTGSMSPTSQTPGQTSPRFLKTCCAQVLTPNFRWWSTRIMATLSSPGRSFP